METIKNEKKWFENKVLVVLLCFIFFPVGLYGLWKNNSFAKSTKILVTGIISLVLVSQIVNQVQVENKIDTEDLSRLSTSTSELIKRFELDSAQKLIDSLKSIGADSTYISEIEKSLSEKKKTIEELNGKYIYSNSGVRVIIELSPGFISSLNGFSNGQSINGLNSKGKFDILNDTIIRVDWETKEFNKTMGDLIYDNKNKSLRIANGTVYKKSTESSDKNLSKYNSVSTPKKKKYVMFCGEQYEDGTNFRNFLPSDYQDRAGYYCMKNYREGASSVYYSGYNNAGILVTAVGELTGEKHIILFMCDGSIY